MTTALRYSDKRMTNPFEVFVLFEGRMKFDVSALWEATVREFPEALSKEGCFATGMIDTDEVASLATVFGLTEGALTIASFRGHRCTEQHYSTAVSRAFHFPGAAEALKRHTGYVTISASCKTIDLAERYKTARAVTCLAAIAAAAPKCVALIFPSGDIIAAPDFWREEANKLNSDTWPLAIWISINMAHGQLKEAGPVHCRTGTIGMAAFNGHEFDYFWAPVEPIEAVQSVLGGAHLLLEQGHVFKDGDTLGIEDEQDRLILRHRSEGKNAQTDQWVIVHPRCPYDMTKEFGPNPAIPPPPGVDNIAKGERGFMKRLLRRILN